MAEHCFGLAFFVGSGIPFRFKVVHAQLICLIQFRLFVGLLTNSQGRKINGGKAAPEESDSDSEMETETANGVAQAAAPRMIDEAVKRDQITELDDVQEDKLNAFLNDPEQTIKIFLSSHMRKQGLIWYVSRVLPPALFSVCLLGPIAI